MISFVPTSNRAHLDFHTFHVLIKKWSELLLKEEPAVRAVGLVEQLQADPLLGQN